MQERQLQLYRDREKEAIEIASLAAPPAIESPDFPFEHLSEIAELESWRKEIHRPLYYLHKWWAHRLGSVFRAIVLGTFSANGDLLKLFYQPVDLQGVVVFDPFMGSGTTVGEALKLGARAIGRDINPVSYFMVRTALRRYSRHEVIKTFREIERDVAPELRRLYQARLSDGKIADVLYYFWVKTLPCPTCGERVDLFSTYIFARHAYPSRYPKAHAICPSCNTILALRYDAEEATCAKCGQQFNPQTGPAQGRSADCLHCKSTFSILEAVRRQGHPPTHRLYAKLILRPDGSKAYLPVDEYDLELYEEAQALLRKRRNPYPVVPIEPGYNTNQILNHGYTHWHQMFNDRQLYCLSLLAERIRGIEDEGLRDLFTCLFSSILEFNNMFASYKGEGTGAVRPLFSHHILKPERMPIEANIWGTPKSSGSFSTLFERRILRALEYRENPFEIRVVRKNGKPVSEKVYGLSRPLSLDLAHSFEEFRREGKPLYLSCGDSSRTDLDTASVDAVITDPPFFDNVHYSQLADFFYVWQRFILGGHGPFSPSSTRDPGEVQSEHAEVFTERLTAVFKECHRVLRPEGLLVFTYHHSREEGWRCVLEALMRAGFLITAAHPIKAEMAVAVPKSQAREPIDLDVILVCRKRSAEGTEGKPSPSIGELMAEADAEAEAQIRRLNRVGKRLSRNDVRVVLMAQVVRLLSYLSSPSEAVLCLESQEKGIEGCLDRLYRNQLMG